MHSYYIYLNTYMVRTYVKLQEVCAPYWCSGKTNFYEDITVTVISESQEDGYTKRVFQITDIKV